MNVLILVGDYEEQVIQVADAFAAQGIADGWARALAPPYPWDLFGNLAAGKGAPLPASYKAWADAGYPAVDKGIVLSNNAIDDTAAPGTIVGALSVVGAGAGPWTYSLTDNAGNRFAVSGSNLVTGTTALSHASAPTPAIVIRATNGVTEFTKSVVMNVRAALPALPLAAGARLNIIGHSQLGYTHYAGIAIAAANAAVGTDAKGCLAHYHTYDPRFDMDSWYDISDPFGRNIVGADHAVFAAHLDGIDAQFPVAMAHRPQALIIMGATNTISTGDPGVQAANADYCKTKVEAYLQKARNEGVHVLLMTDFPRGSWVADPLSKPDAAKDAALIDYNNWVKAQAGREGVKVIDLWATLAPGGVLDTTLFQPDKTHLNPVGGAKAAKDPAFAAAMQAVFAAGEQVSTDPTGADQLLTAANYNFAATGSAVSGTQITGTKATSLSIGSGGATSPPAGGSTVVCSMEAIGVTGRNKQVLDITPADSGSGNAYHGVGVLFANGPVAALAAGDWVRFCCQMDLGGAFANLAEFRLAYAVAQATTQRANQLLLTTSSAEFALLPGQPPGSRKLITPPMQIPLGQTFDRLTATLTFFWSRLAVGAFQAKVHSPKWIKAADPRPARGY